MNTPIIDILRDQRNTAMDAAADAAAHVLAMDKRIVQNYKLLAQIIKSDQLTHEDVQKLIMDDEQFAEWYAKQPKP